MFETQENECVGFDSRWKVTRVLSAGSSQTTEYSLQEIHTSTASTAEMETQTDDLVVKEPDVDMDKLNDWLKKIYPSVKKEIDEANNSQAFRNYHPIKNEVNVSANLLQTIKLFPENTKQVILPVSALSWNCSGQTLAISCSHNHSSWCYHSGALLFYTFNRKDELPDQHSKKLSTESCITNLKFHPTLPNIIAGGSFAGEVIIWNCQHEDSNSIIAKVRAHEERLTQMSWITDIDPAKSILLATSSLDGFLNLWNFKFATGTLKIKQKYNVKPPLLGRLERKSETPAEIATKIVRGIICFDFSPYVPERFVVGAEGGLVVQCSMLGATPLKGSSTNIPLSDPVYKYYQPHEGELISISFSPNRREMFMTNGTEGEIRVYILDQDEPAQVIFLEKPLQVVSWIPFEEKIICGCGSMGRIEVFNLISGRPMNNVTKEKLGDFLMTEMDINKKRPTTVAIGNVKGSVQLWNVPWGSFSVSI